MEEIDRELNSLRKTYSTFIEWLEYKRDGERVWELKRQYMRFLACKFMMMPPWRYQ